MSTNTHPPRLLTTKQAAELLQVSELTIKRRVYSGELESIKIGRARRIPAQSLERYIQTNGAPSFEIEMGAADA